MTIDEFLVFGLQGLIAYILYFFNTKWYYSVKTKRLMSLIFWISIGLSLLSAFGRVKFEAPDRFVINSLRFLVYLQIMAQALALFTKSLLFVYQKLTLNNGPKNPEKRNYKGVRFSIKRKIYLLIGFSVISIFLTLTLVRKLSLSDCELNFIEGNGISKEAYRRIQDDNRVLTMEELIELAGVMKGGDLESNLKRLLINEIITYSPCIKTNITPNKTEKSYIKERLLRLRNQQEKCIYQNKKHIDTLVVQANRLTREIEELGGRRYNRGYDWFTQEKGHPTKEEILLDRAYFKTQELERIQSELSLRNDSIQDQLIWKNGIKAIPFDSIYIYKVIKESRLTPLAHNKP